MVSDDVTLAAVERFNDAFSRHDVDAVMASMTDDCVFESTAPPLGTRVQGAAALSAAWEEFFASSPTARFAAEETIVAGDRSVVRRRYTAGGTRGPTTTARSARCAASTCSPCATAR